MAGTQQGTAILAHGAGSGSTFLRRAFPAARLGVSVARYLDDRTGAVGRVARRLRTACIPGEPSLVGGVSLGAHAAAGLLCARHRPADVVAGLLVMPAWTGRPDRVAELTAAAADAVAALGPDGVLADLDPTDWVTTELAEAWAFRDPVELVAELRRAAHQPAPTPADLATIDVPVGIVALSDDPLHPEEVARRWAEVIPAAAVVVLDRDRPMRDRAVFADAAVEALAAAGAPVPGRR